jgi:alkylhydroperoxidase family enzyme
MSRFQNPDPNLLDSKFLPLFEDSSNWFRISPNLTNIMSLSPSTLEAHLDFVRALSNGSVNGQLRQTLPLTISELTKSQYCTAMHTALKKLNGMSEEEIIEARKGSSPDKAVAQALRFVRKVIQNYGHIENDDFTKIKQAGYSDAQIIEIIAQAANHLLLNFIANINQMPTGFPRVKPLEQDQ